jgi:hypothetical protein
MEIPRNIQVCFASLEADAHIGFEAAQLRPKGWAGDRGSAYPRFNPRQLAGFS